MKCTAVSTVTHRLLALLLLGIPSLAGAATFTVDTVTDTLDIDGACSLREALLNASSDLQHAADCPAGSGDDSIGFAPALFSGSPPVATIALDPELGQLVVQGSSLSIAPPPGMRLRLVSAGSHRVMNVDTGAGAQFELRDTELRGGSEFYGGGLALYAQFALLDGVHFIDNSTLSYSGGGGLYRSIGHSSGLLQLRNCVFRDNRTASGGAAALVNVNSDDDLQVESCRFEANEGTTSGALWIAVGDIDSAGTPELEISGSVFADNVSSGNGGALTIGATAIGSRYLATISDSRFSANRAPDGGAVSITAGNLSPSVSLALHRNSFIENLAGHGTPESGAGGAITAQNVSLQLVNNLFLGNAAPSGGAALHAWMAASILERELEVVGNSFIGNQALLPETARTLSLQLPGDASGWSLKLQGNAVAPSPSVPPSGECRLQGENMDLVAVSNIAADPSCLFGPDDTLADPQLVVASSSHPMHPLSAYPQPGSPAIDLWPASLCKVDGLPLEQDLRGNPRPRDGDGSGAADCDAGAFEVGEAGVLTVQRTGTGSGTVTSAPAGIDCGGTCTLAFPGGTPLTLTASAAPGSVFSGWSGACSGTGPCQLTVSGNASVTAQFTTATSHLLAVTLAGDGEGAVSSMPSGIACTPACSASFASGTQVTLQATPAADAVFAGWSGACSGSGACVVTMSTARNVTATFNATAFVGEVTRSGAGNGRVTSTPAGIDCPGQCSALFDRGLSVGLQASASPGSRFLGWHGDCSGSGACTIDMEQGPFLVDARFGLLRNLQVQLAGSGTGSVASTPAGISCPGSCSADFDQGSQVVLSATPAPGSVFAGWVGAAECTGTGPCQLTMDFARTVSASFQAGLATLSVAVTGGGRITSSPAGIDCPGDCSETYSPGAMVTLVPQPQTGVVFSHWEGDCSGSGACTLTMNAARSVTAHFTPGAIFGNGFE